MKKDLIIDENKKIILEHESKINSQKSKVHSLRKSVYDMENEKIKLEGLYEKEQQDHINLKNNLTTIQRSHINQILDVNIYDEYENTSEEFTLLIR